MGRFNFGSAIFAGIVATVVMTIVMYFLGMNIMLAIGSIAGFEGGGAYVIGGIVHFIIGIFWACIYGFIFEPMMKRLPGFLSGAFFSILPFVLSLFLMGVFIMTIKGIFTTDRDIAKKQEMSYNCSPNDDYNGNGCAPCGGYAMDGADPYSECKPCGPSNGGGGGWFISLINHLAYGVVLGLVYRPRAPKETAQ